MNEQVIKFIKKLGGLLVMVGTGVIMGGITEKSTEHANLAEKICAGTAAMVIGGLVTKEAQKYLEVTVDECAEQVNKALEENNGRA